MLAEDEIEELGKAVVTFAGQDPERSVDALRLAYKVVGPIIQLAARGLPPTVTLCRVHGQQRVYVRGELHPTQLAWSLAHETAECILGRLGYQESDVELVANRLAAALKVPRPFAERACRERGRRWKQLALDFGISQTAAVMRYGEVTRMAVAVLTKETTYFRGDWFERPSVRKLRSDRPGPNIRKARLSDDGSREVAVRVA